MVVNARVRFRPRWSPSTRPKVGRMCSGNCWKVAVIKWNKWAKFNVASTYRFKFCNARNLRNMHACSVDRSLQCLRETCRYLRWSCAQKCMRFFFLLGKIGIVDRFFMKFLVSDFIKIIILEFLRPGKLGSVHCDLACRWTRTWQLNTHIAQ
jgi:hypothetical protein